MMARQQKSWYDSEHLTVAEKGTGCPIAEVTSFDGTLRKGSYFAQIEEHFLSDWFLFHNEKWMVLDGNKSPYTIEGLPDSYSYGGVARPRACGSICYQRCLRIEGFRGDQKACRMRVLAVDIVGTVQYAIQSFHRLPLVWR